MDELKGGCASRRRFLKTAGAYGVVAAGVAPSVLTGKARAAQKTLKIMQWKHFVPGHDRWFNDTYIKEWSERNDTRVIVDHVGLGDVMRLAAAEAEAGQGHDLVMLLASPSVYEDHVIDHREVYQECERLYGKAPDFAIKSTYSPKSQKYYGFAVSILPPIVTYRKDLWDTVGGAPNSWQDVLAGGRRIKLLHEKPVGISLAPEHNSDHTLRSIMYSFGASVQDADANPSLKSKATLESIKFVKSLYEQAMSDEVLNWDASSNNRYMLTGDGCLTVDTMSIVRASENKKLPVADDLWLAKLPEGPEGRLGPSFGILTYFIWKFAENPEGAKKFLVDLIASSQQSFLASGFQNMPAFSGATPDLASLISSDPNTALPEKYSVLADAASWTTNFGYPGHANAAIGEIYAKHVIPTMCAQAATGKLTPEEALDQADKQVLHIFQTWKEKGKI